jgi:hypothetical protein
VRLAIRLAEDGSVDSATITQETRHERKSNERNLHPR